MATTPTTRADLALRRAAAASQIIRKNSLLEAFVADNLASRPTDIQTEILKAIGTHQYRYVTSGNQGGKTSLAVRDLTWFLERRHPYFTWPEDWSPVEPLVVLVCGQDRSQLETMWRTRALPFLNRADWQEVKSGQVIQAVVHRKRGDRVILMPHNYGSEHDVSHMNFYSAHYVWVDEPPKTVRVIEELQRRTDAKRSPFLFTFTLKYRNDRMQRYVDSVDSRVGKVFKLAKLDNPIFADRKEFELAKLAGLSEAQRRAGLYGDWITSETSVYEYLPEVHGGSPRGYTPGWRHVLSVDPAERSKTGVTMFAECPKTGVWWAVFADYVEATYNPLRLIEAVEAIAAKVSPNIILRIYDASASWYADLARSGDLPSGKVYEYVPVLHKAGRKEQMIANFQMALGTTLRIADDMVPKLVNEITDYERNEADPLKIKKAQRFHLLDGAHYFVDRMPSALPRLIVEHPHETIRRLHDEHERALAAARSRPRIPANSIFNRKWTRW